MAEVMYRDPFNATLLNSPALLVTAEQDLYIRDILNICCSDSKFAEKAYAALAVVLTAGSVMPPVVISLEPTSVVLGSPSFDIHVKGSGFNPYSVIVFNGFEEPTTFISDTELTTGVNMPLWQAPAVVPIRVRNFGVISDPVDFGFVNPDVPEPEVLSTKAEKSEEVKKSDKKKLAVEEHYEKEKK